MQDIFSFRTPDLTVKSSQALSPEGPLRDFGGPLLHRRLWGKASLSTIRTCLYITQLIKLSDLISQLLFSLTAAASLLLTRNENLFLNGSCLIYLIAHYYLNFFLNIEQLRVLLPSLDSGVGMVQMWERSQPSAMARVRFRDGWRHVSYSSSGKWTMMITRFEPRPLHPSRNYYSVIRWIE